jgi:uncharacterized protein YndB with AHSA1/START domain
MAQDTDNPCHTPGVAHGHELVLRRVFDAAPDQIWKAWMEPALLQRWFCPKPWYVTDAVIEPRPGGRFNCVMHGPNGEVMPNSGVFLEVVPQRKWTTTDAFTPDWKPAGQPFMVATVELIPLADGKTEYVATARHWNEATMKQHEAMGFHEGWGAAADQLAELLKEMRS